MRLKRLVLQGYKTFASKTEFVFDEGITTIVGPNGSGKSNVADAIRWVLGEQSYSTLRGKRTTDMIFSGSQFRPRAGMAQAILTLDNSNGWLPIDYSEVEIGRRAYRSGENEYILNGQKVRLRDITDLLATSGLSQRTYTIIGQGLIDQALSLRSEERRALFEEAAGINHYKSRRAETLRRLQETQRNLQRVHDILAEIRPRLTSLKRQATRAQNYEQISTDLQVLLRQWYGYKWEQSKEQLRLARETAVTAEENWQTTRRQLIVQQQNADDVRQRLGRLQQQQTSLQDERDSVRDELETARRNVAILQERRQAATRQLADIEADLPAIQQQHQQAEAQLSEALKALAEAQTELTSQQTELRTFQSAFQTQQHEINRWQQAQKTATTARQQAQTMLAQAEGRLTQLQERLQEQRAESETAVDDNQLATLQQQIAEGETAVRTAQEAVNAQQQTRQSVQEQRQALIQTLKRLRQALQNEERNLRQAQSSLARSEARVEMLDQQRLKQVTVANPATLLGHLAGLITIPDAHQTAVSAALQERLATLLFTDTAALRQFAQSDRSGQMAIALDRLHLPEQPPLPSGNGVIGWGSDLVQASDEQSKQIVDCLLRCVLLVKSAEDAFETAVQLPDPCLVAAADGFLAFPNGAVQTPNDRQNSDILSREENWRAAQAALEQERTAVQQLADQIEASKADIQDKQEAVDGLLNELNQIEQQQREAAQTLAQVQRALDRDRQQAAYVQRQTAVQQEAVVRLESRIAAVEAEIVSQREAVTVAETAVLEASDQLEALPVAEATQQRETLQQSIQAAQTIVAGRQAVVDSRRATLQQVENQLNRLKGRQSALQQQQAQIADSDEATTLQALQQKLDDLTGRLAPLRSRMTEYREELLAFEEKTAVLQKQTHDRETQYTQTKVAYTQRTNQIEALQERIKADLGIVSLEYDDEQTGPTPLPISGVEALPKVTELPVDIEETIQQYRGQIHRMGAINPDAPVEYDELLERHDFLEQQIDDLTRTEAKLRDIINDLDELTSRAFAETVDNVNAVFGDTFTQLFGGGDARLVLTEPDDLTVSGVDIIARLPNRREQGLGLLSGGERSLTAAALIFSLLKVSPTPFCVMDEVDAALDEANINRFRDLLRELTAKTQFIVITHNRGTVQAARTIYGISMGQDSASQVISIKPEDYVKQPELI